MKKTLFLALGATMLTLASCSNDADVVVNQGSPISFNTPVVSRATETTTANIKSIYVNATLNEAGDYFAFSNFIGNSEGNQTAHNAEFNINEGGKVYYWPENNAPLYFWAFAGTTDKTNFSVSIPEGSSDTQLNVTNFAPNSDISSQNDIVAAFNTGSRNSNENTAVKLHFGHLLSQIEVKAKNSNAAYKISVKNIKIGGIKTTASAVVTKMGNILDDPNSTATSSVTCSDWTFAENAATGDYSFSSNYTTAKEVTSTAASIMTSEGNNAFVLPQGVTAWNKTDRLLNGNTWDNNKNAYLAVLVNILTDANGQAYPLIKAASKGQAEVKKGDYAWIVVPLSSPTENKWEAGKKYVYTLDFTKGAGSNPEGPNDVLKGEIKFTCCVEGFGNPTEYFWNQTSGQWSNTENSETTPAE